ncbi:mitochondrial mRNA processing protein PET127, putative [Paecilomyces variotii No. 5]|uniref:Mitochondrial mRNA processing protein PET127, putative n=1 Tax=Byssochlamys spectabilis (strain No. 5 / NBRC 109023) TaxID=1356009 RepID=V5FPI7_BYSSN|nr:mitochondrial mRNA processing protein PET127, putative [Paecilomyces variotii No. 5]
MFRASLRSVSDPFRDQICFACLARRSIVENSTRPSQFYRTYSSGPEHGGDGLGAPPQPADSSIRLTGKKPVTRPRPPVRKQPVGLPNEILHKAGVRGSKPKPAKNDQTQTPPPAQAADSKSSRNKQRKKSKNAAKESQKAQSTVEGESQTEKAESKVDLPKIRRVHAKLSGKPAAAGSVADTNTSTANAAGKPKDDATPHFKGLISAKQLGKLDAENLALTPLDVETGPVPNLSFGLERVLFNPGVYHLRDPRSRVYNFDPYLGEIMPVTEFDFDALKDYITSSKDETLRKVAAQQGKKYVGSSSSMTSVLAHFHYLLSGWRAVNISMLSQMFPDKIRSFTRLLRAPAAMFLHYQDGVYAIDADKEFDSANILMNLGKSMEKLLTLPKEEFERYRRSSENKISPEEEQATPEAYHYSTAGDFIMRSQLDAYDPRLPGTGMFDLKTRAVVSIRMDAKNFEHGLGYQIKNRYGAYESYEREYYDMIRAAFLKYSLQVRVGRMDGIFVAFHNIQRIFGFQYVSLPEMDLALHGQTDTALGDTEFRLSLSLWNTILDKATARFPKQSLRFHFETRDTQVPYMYIFAEPVTPENIHAIQTRNKEAIDEYQRRVLNLGPEKKADEAQKPESTTSETNSESGAKDTTANSETTQRSPAEEFDSLHGIKSEEPEQEPRDLLAMTLLVRNFVNGRPVARPMNFTANDKWTIEYELSEMKPSRTQALYDAVQKRRWKALEGRGEDETDLAANVYIRKLRDISKQGREWREEQDKIDKEKGVVVLTDPIPRNS